VVGGGWWVVVVVVVVVVMGGTWWVVVGSHGGESRNPVAGLPAQLPRTCGEVAAWQ
jgi:hypothetical protein